MQNSTQQGKAENERAANLGKSSPEMGRLWFWYRIDLYI